MDCIDVHHHAVPPFYTEAAAAALAMHTHGSMPPLVRTWTPLQSLEAMQEHGIAAAILSISAPGVWFGDDRAAAGLARRCNEYMAELARAHRATFGFFAALPLPDVDGALAEIAYGLDELEADGIGMLSSYENRWLGDPHFAPVFAELDRRNAVVYVHPTAPACCENVQPGIVPPMLEFVFDTTRTIASLIFGGTLARFPKVRFIFSHGGGTLPMLRGRIAAVGRETRGDLATAAPDGIDHLIAKLHFDIASSMHPAAYAALRAGMELAQLLFGTDYPFQPIEPAAHGVERLVTIPRERNAIRGENALRIFPQFAR